MTAQAAMLAIAGIEAIVLVGSGISLGIRFDDAKVPVSAIVNIAASLAVGGIAIARLVQA